jgi:hypothetical protein
LTGPLCRLTIQGTFQVVALVRQHFTDTNDKIGKRFSCRPMVSDTNCMWCDVWVKDRSEHAALGRLTRIRSRQIDFGDVVVFNFNCAVWLHYQAVDQKFNLIFFRWMTGNGLDVNATFLIECSNDFFVV